MRCGTADAATASHRARDRIMTVVPLATSVNEILNQCNLRRQNGLGGAISAISVRYAGDGVGAASLWPVHCRTPRYALHGPTATRYWWAITREIWCTCVRS